MRRCKEELLLSIQHWHIWPLTHNLFLWFLLWIYVLEKLIMSEGKVWFFFFRFLSKPFSEPERYHLPTSASFLYLIYTHKSSKGLCKFRKVSTCKSYLAGESHMCLENSVKTFPYFLFLQGWRFWAAHHFFPSSVVRTTNFDNAVACDWNWDGSTQHFSGFSARGYPPRFND